MNIPVQMDFLIDALKSLDKESKQKIYLKVFVGANDNENSDVDTDSDIDANSDIIEELLESPLKISGFKPFKREEIYDRV